MLSDSNAINDFNPFVMGDISLPGTSRQPQQFDRHPIPRQYKEMTVVTESSPICEYGITAGSKTIDMCHPTKPKCSLSRPLIPGRNIDRGFTVLKKNVEKVAERTKKCNLSLPKLILIFLILLIALY